jgi:2-keto-4-pentenoate hydratase
VITEAQIAEAAQALFDAESASRWTDPVSDRYPEADVDDAYRIALAVADLKRRAGRSVRGHKIGLTSAPMQKLAGSTEPDYGFIFDDWFVPEGAVVHRSRMNRPLVEVEVAFVMGRPIKGPNVTAADVIRAVEFIMPAIEVVDSRYSKLGSKLLVDSISDAASCGFVVVGGNAAKLTEVDPRRVSASLSINGQIRESGTAAAVMGNPINAVCWLANKLHEFGVSLAEGDVVLSGSFVKAIPFAAGDTVSALFDELGEVQFGVTT